MKSFLVFEKINHSDIIPKQIIRLGKAQQDKIRPIKVILPTSNVRKPILDNTKNLKSAGEEFRKIFIKKDIHPGIRKEFNRLREATNAETNKPENAGKQVVYNRDTRTLSIDGVVVDRFKPSFFL